MHHLAFMCYGAYMAVGCKTHVWYHFLCSLRHLQRGVGWCTFSFSHVYLPHRSYHRDLGCSKETSCHLHLINETTSKRCKRWLTVIYICIEISVENVNAQKRIIYALSMARKILFRTYRLQIKNIGFFVGSKL